MHNNNNNCDFENKNTPSVSVDKKNETDLPPDIDLSASNDEETWRQERESLFNDDDITDEINSPESNILSNDKDDTADIDSEKSNFGSNDKDTIHEMNNVQNKNSSPNVDELPKDEKQ